MSFLGPIAGALRSVANRVFRLDEKTRQTTIACLAFVKEHAEAGNPQSVLDAIDEFSSKRLMMNVGRAKGAIVDEEIRKKKPRVMAELGAFVGYSAVRFASLQREVSGPGAHYYSFEFSPEFADITRQMVAVTGLSDSVTVITGAFTDQYTALKDQTVDIFFIDHEKSVYLSDAQLILANSMLRKGSLLVADNVLFPGAPDYLAFLDGHAQFNTQLHEAEIKLPFFTIKDAISVSEFQGANVEPK